MKNVMIFIIKFYRRFISPWIGPSCRYYPTCSQYAITAYEKYGFFKGTIKTVWRIMRCNPCSPGGYDPA